jgi:hypothetical protein
VGFFFLFWRHQILKLMTQEEKELLLKDLCARLAYGVKVQNILNGEVFDLKTRMYCLPTALATNFKPYLRSLSSMTEEERSELRIIWHEDFVGDSSLSAENLGIAAIYPCYPKTTDFYLSHHFDYRGLIEKGLALEAPDGMYNYTQLKI